MELRVGQHHLGRGPVGLHPQQDAHGLHYLLQRLWGVLDQAHVVELLPVRGQDVDLCNRNIRLEVNN